MRTNIELDDALVERAMRSSGARTKRAVVEAALQLLVKTHEQSAIRRLRGKVEWEGNLNESRRGPGAGVVCGHDHRGYDGVDRLPARRRESAYGLARPGAEPSAPWIDRSYSVRDFAGNRWRLHVHASAARSVQIRGIRHRRRGAGGGSRAELSLPSIQRTYGPQDHRLPDRNLLSNGEAFPSSPRPRF